MEIIFGLIVIVAIVVGVNYYRRPDWTKRKIAQLREMFK